MPEDKTGLTALHIAAAHRNWDISQFLLSNDDLDGWVEDNLDRPIIAFAYSTGDPEFIELFRKRLLPHHMVETDLKPIL